MVHESDFKSNPIYTPTFCLITTFWCWLQDQKVRLIMWLKTHSLIVVTLFLANTDAFLISRYKLPPYDFNQGIQTEYQRNPESYDSV